MDCFSNILSGTSKNKKMQKLGTPETPRNVNTWPESVLIPTPIIEQCHWSIFNIFLRKIYWNSNQHCDINFNKLNFTTKLSLKLNLNRALVRSL